MAKQLLTPNPNIWCRPGWCLQYVRETFGIPRGVQPTATAGWNASPTQHRDRNFPAGVWIPVWFSLRNVPAGHVALMAPNGNVYSTSDDSNTPHCHPDLDDLINYYNYWGQPITYLGWTEDIENVTVIDMGSVIESAGEITTTPTEEDDMFTDNDRALLTAVNEAIFKGGESTHKNKSLNNMLGSIWDAIFAGGASMPGGKSLSDILGKVASAPAAAVDPATLAASIAAAIPADLAQQVADELGKRLQGGN